MIVDYYQVLRVPPDADLPTIKKAFRACALESHPDRGGSHEAMVAINTAFDILSHPESRRHYDEARRDQSNAAALQKTRDDADRARQGAENYPRDWSEFEAWLNSLAEDFASAKYGKDGMWPTVDDSTSGCLFLMAGAVAGIALAAHLFINGHVRNQALLFCIVAGATAGAWLHKAIGTSIKAGRRSRPAPGSTDLSQASDTLVKCPKCGQQLRYSQNRPGVRLRCPKCNCQFHPGTAHTAPQPSAGHPTVVATKKCTWCGREKSPEATFCRECGTPFGG